jgi:protein-tyrosine kinase
MGKLFDAIEKYKEESAIIPERLPIRESNGTMENDGQLRYRRDLISSTGVSPKLFAYTAPDSIDAEIFNVIKGHLLFPKDGQKRRTILVTSAFPGEGKTLVAANLAVNLAMGVHESVLLVDCDLRRPSMHKMLGYKNKEGLYEYLKGERKLEDLLIKTKIEKLTLLTAGKRTRQPTDLFASSMMKDFLTNLKEESENRFVILDGSPCQVTAEASVLANHVDGIVFVIMARRSPRDVIRKSTEALGKNKILGIVFNGYTKAYKSYDRYYKRYYKEESR